MSPRFLTSSSLTQIAKIANLTSSLRKSPAALETLREKLFLLWGDLEEQKARSATALKPVDGNSASSSKKNEASRTRPPFQCCIKEYGVKKKKKRTQLIREGDGSEGDDESEDGHGDDWVWERRWRMFGCIIS